MQPTSQADIDGLLQRCRDGDDVAAQQLIATLYPALKTVAQRNVRRYAGSLTLSATELLHETFLRLDAQSAQNWVDSEHVIAIASTLMRRAAVDYLRGRRAEKRGGGIPAMALDAMLAHQEPVAQDDSELLDLERALQELAGEQTGIAAVAELKLFSGMTNEEIASCCEISTATVVRHWRFARAWLTQRLADPGAGEARDSG